jgi:F-type H+-transporting ATPase subunit delta
MRDLVRGYATAVLDGVGLDAGTVASELGAFGAALVHFDALRQALTDATVAPASRRAVVVDLLGDRASPQTVALLGFTAHYEHASELAPSVATLVGLAEQVAAAPEADLVGPPAGRSAARERLRGYAERVFEELVDDAAVDRVGDEMFTLSRLLEESERLRHVLADADVPYHARAAVLEDLLAGRAAPATVRLARYVLRNGRTRDLVGTFEWLVELAARERGMRLAEVRSAVELETGEIARLATALGRLVARRVTVRVVVDSSVVGGLLVSVGDLVIDGTVRLRLERLRDALALSS